MAKYDEFIIEDPKTVFMDYGLYSMCNKVPVALENNPDAENTWMATEQFPTVGFMRYLIALRNQGDDFRKQKIARTILRASNGDDFYLYLLPNLDFVGSDGWSFAMTPDIRRKFACKIREFKKLNPR
jgi:hypothetical protein